MRRLVDTTFTVRVPLAIAWDHLSQVEKWPSWAKHIKHAATQPPGPLGPTTRGVFKLSNGVQTAFEMSEFHPERSWKWVGKLAGASIYYDHIFESLGPNETRIRFTVDSQGGWMWLLGGVFGWIYRRNLERAIPLLIAEINRRAAS